jgi:hypothetical protein
MNRAIWMLAALGATPVLAAADGKPNVVILVTHDTGGAGTSAKPAAPTPTPNRDAWARKGVAFVNAYSAAPQPGPADSALLTGRYPQRIGFDIDPDPAAEGPATFDAPQPTLAQSLKAAGYATGAFGDEPADAAVVGKAGQRGFDDVKLVADPSLDGAAAFIQAHAAQPFLAYISLDGTGSDLDARLAQVTSLLHDRALEGNTLLVLVQEQQGSPWTLRAEAVRARWTLVRPGAIPAGRAVQQTVGAVDLAPTILAALGVAPGADQQFEGANLYPLAQNPDAQQPDRRLFWRLGPQYAVQQGNWTLLKSAARDARPKLYDLGSDPAERVDLFENQGQRAGALQAQWDAWNGGNQPPRWTDFRWEGQPTEVADGGDSAGTATREFGPFKTNDSLQGREAPAVAGKALDISAEVESDGSDGVIVSQGAGGQGYALYVINGKLEFAVREGGELTSITAGEPLGKGTFTVEATLKDPGKLAVLVNGKQVATGDAPGLIPRQPKVGFFVGRAGSEAVGNNPTPRRVRRTSEQRQGKARLSLAGGHRSTARSG